jgi:hypothetical protein
VSGWQVGHYAYGVIGHFAALSLVITLRCHFTSLSLVISLRCHWSLDAYFKDWKPAGFPMTNDQ